MDDILVWAKDLQTLGPRLCIILDRCRKANITISDSKFEISNCLKFAGHIVADYGIGPDPERI